MRLKITLVCENTAGAAGTLGAHGLAWWLHVNERNILFDTGQGMTLQRNARTLDIPVTAADAIVLSHGHYDHTGGLVDAWNACAAKPPVYLHPAATAAKYARDPDGTTRFIGMPAAARDLLESELVRTIYTENPTEILPGVFATGTVPRKTDFETVGDHFVADSSGTIPDTLIDDQAVYIPGPTGTVLLLGCTHSGIVNTLELVAGLTGSRRFRLVAGGLHLHSASDERLAATLRALETFDIAEIAPCHCTGTVSSCRIWQTFPDSFVPARVGTTFETE